MQGRFGFCPHCRHSNIRIRRCRHDNHLWRCRSCNRTFSTPLVAEAVVSKSAVSRYVLAVDIPRLEYAAHRRRRKRFSFLAVLVWSAVLVLFVGVVLFGIWNRLGMEPARQEDAQAVAARPIQQPDPTATVTPRPYIVVPTVEPTPVPPPAERHLSEKEYMLKLINAVRANAGAEPVVLGTNIAPQLHAEAALEHCFGSQWGMDGLKPYMRYSIAGGYQANAENAHGSDYCITWADGIRAVGDIRDDIDEAIAGWMDSPGHRRTMLDPIHKNVNIGIAWDRYNVKAFQHFEGDYVTFTAMPTIRGGVLSFEGEVKNGAGFRNLQDLGVQVYYDPPPAPLTLGQVSRTYCYDSGQRVASLREPLTDGQYWASATYMQSYSPCPDPADVPLSAPAASSPDEADRMWQDAHDQSESKPIRSITVPWVTADRFAVQGDTFLVEANVEEILRQYGPGVYTISVWARAGNEPAVVAEYSIFHETEPPDSYTD